MELDEFALNYPDLYRMLTDSVNSMIIEHNITGDMPLQDWDSIVAGVISGGSPDYYYDGINDINAVPAIAPIRDFDRFNDFDRGRRFVDFDRDRFRRRDFDLRDIVRLIFLRELFDRRHRR